MKNHIYIAMTVAAILAGDVAFAGPLPKPSERADGAGIARLFAGKTWEWEDGHAYFAPDGAFQAAIGYEQSGEGKWFATSMGKLCFRGTWRVGKKGRPINKCWQHVVDSQGQLWQAPVSGTGLWADWTPFDAASQLVPGNPHKFDFDVASGRKERLPVRRVGGRQLAEMYQGKTWKWEDGHAYFGDNGEVTAATENDSFGKGRWYTDAQGDLCIKAEWASPDYDGIENKRCWLHARDANGRLWQTPTDDMRAWYVFDPKQNLVEGNPYAPRVNRLRRRLGK